MQLELGQKQKLYGVACLLFTQAAHAKTAVIFTLSEVALRNILTSY